MIEIIKAAFTAGEVKTFLMQGEYLEILEAAYPVDIAMMDRSGAQLSTMRNAEASYFSRPGKYEVIQVTSSAAQTVRVFVGSGDAGTRKTSGEVIVIDGSKNRTNAGKSFSAASSVSGAAAGKYCTSYLYNPTGSGKNVIVNDVIMSSTTSQIMYLTIGTTVPVGGSFSCTSKKGGGAVASAIKYENNNLTAVNGVNVLVALSVQAGQNIRYQLTEPIVLTPGYWIGVDATTPATDISCTRQFWEEDI